MTTFIRYANTEDADALGFIYSKSYQTAFEGIIPDNILKDAFSNEKRRDGLSKELSQGLWVNIIMFEEDNPIGMMTYGKSRDVDIADTHIELLRIYLLPSCWGQKLGEKLINWTLNELSEKGYKKISLWVIEENVRARKLYERMGFMHDGISRIIDVGKEIRDLRYTKEL